MEGVTKESTAVGAQRTGGAVSVDEQQIHGEGSPNSAGGWVRRIFFGADGLRAGWSLVLFFALITLFEFVTKAGFRYFHHLDPDQMRRGSRYPVEVMIVSGVPFLVVMLVTLIMSRVERRSVSAYGIGFTVGAARQFVAGLFWGAALLSLLVFTLWRLHLLVFDGMLLSGFDVLRYSAEWAVGFLCVGLFEEALSRGFVLFTVARGIGGPLRFTRLAPYARLIGFWIAAAFFSYLFGAGHRHNTTESPLGLVSAGLLGAVFTLSLWRTGSLWWAIGMHSAWDWAQSFLFGVPDNGHMFAFRLMKTHPQGAPILSGGGTGPEGSIYVLPVIALSVVVILLTLRNDGWPATGSRIAADMRDEES